MPTIGHDKSPNPVPPSLDARFQSFYGDHKFHVQCGVREAARTCVTAGNPVASQGIPLHQRPIQRNRGRKSAKNVLAASLLTSTDSAGLRGRHCLKVATSQMRALRLNAEAFATDQTRFSAI